MLLQKPIPLLCVAVAYTFLGCSSPDKVRGGEKTEGWKSKDGIDTFFMKIQGRASLAAIDAKSSSMMKNSCIESTNLQAADKIVRKMLGEELQTTSGASDGAATGAITLSVRKGLIRGTEVQECAPIDSEGSWKECECIHEVSGPDLRQKFRLEVNKLQEGN